MKLYRHLGGLAVAAAIITAGAAVVGTDTDNTAASANEGQNAAVEAQAGARYGEWTYAITPARLLDTRGSGSVDGGGRVGAIGTGETITVSVAGRGGVPTSATGVLLNVTAVDPTSAGFIAVWPEGAWPGSSNLNFVAGQTIPNMVYSGIGADGAIRIFNPTGATHVLVDVVGYTSPLDQS